MFRTKSDVERHVANCLRKIKGEEERNLRGCNFAQLYLKVKDYDSAKKYVTLYISAKKDSAAAYRVLGEACDGLKQKSQAYAAYKTSLRLEPNNQEILRRVCELLCDPEIEFDPGVARHFLDKAVVLFPAENVVSKLKQKLFSDSTGGDPATLEEVLKDEIKARPSNADVRSKLLTLYVDSGRIKEAYLQSVQIESKQLHNNEIEWYKCINRICEAYYNLKDESIIGDSAFYIHWIYALNRICALSLNEVYKVQDDLGNCSDYIFLFDQILWRAKQNVTNGSEVYQGFMTYMAAQLTFYMANLLIKQSRSLTNEIKSLLGILILLSTVPPFTQDAICRPSIKETHRKLFLNLLHEGNCRYLQSAYILHHLGKDYGTAKPYIEFLEHKMKNDWISNLMMKFTSEGNKKTSYFLSNANLKIPQSLPSIEKLDKSSYGNSFEIVYPGSLHHQVWLGLRHVENPGSILHCKLSSPVNITFPRFLQTAYRNLKNYGIDTFNQLDIESFLYASIFSATLVKEEYARDPSKLEFLPVDISSLLCTPEQAKWWKIASKPLSESGFKISEVTTTIQNGIRAVRGDRTPLPLLILMARAFSQKCNESNNDDIEHRAHFLWEKAIAQLENLNSNDGHTQNYYEINKSMFEYSKRIIPIEIPKLLNEGRYFIGQYLMKKQQYDEAVELLKPIRTPESFYCLAMIHKSLTEDESTGFYTSEITPEVRNRSVSLLIKAKEYCTLAQEMTNTNHKHPFYYKIESLMTEIEEMLFKAENDQEIDNEGNASIGSEGHMNGDSFKMSTPIKFQNYSRNSNTTRRTFTEPRHRANCADLVELVGIQQSNSQLKMQQVLEQTRLVLDKLESLAFEQKTQRGMIDDLSSKFAGMQTDVKNSLSEIRKEIKKTDLYNVLEDEDYNEEAVQYPNYQAPNYFQAQRMQNNQGALNANLPGYIPPRTPEQIFQTNLGFIPYDQQQRISELLLRGGTIPPQVLNHKMQPPIVNMLPKGPTLPVSSQMNLPSLPASTQMNLPSLPASTQMNYIPSQMNLAMPGVSEMNNPTLPASLGLASFGTNTFQAPKFNMFNTQTSESRGPTNVVITTSDTLPTGAPPVQPALSVTIPPQHRLGDTSHQFQISVPHTVQQPKQQAAQPESDDDNTDNETSNQEYDPIPDYKPIVTLSEVPVVTGEESEEPLFSTRARLYRFVEDCWKERGIGIMKILKHKNENRARILMRREAVHKVCANHVLSSDMNLSPGSSPNTWVWCAQDFADEKLENEKFCIKFKTKEETDRFKEVFDKAKNFSSPKKDKSANMSFTTPDSNSSVPSTPKTSLFSTPKPMDSTDNKTVLGGFTFSSTPTIKPAEEPVTSTPPKQVEEKKNVFGSFSFSTAPSSTVETPKSTASGLFSNVSLRSSLLTNVAPSFSKSPEAKTTAADKPFSNLFSTPTQQSTLFSGLKEQPKFTPPKSEAKIESKPLFSAVGLNTPKTTESSGFPLLKSSPGFNFSPMINAPVFGSSSTLEKTNTIFGSKETKDSKSETPDFSALSQNKGAVDFSTLAKGDSGFEFGKTSSVFGTTSGFKGAGSKIFGSQFESEKPSLFSSMENSFQEAKNVESSQTDDDQSEFVPTASFKPVIDLPDEVQVVSGEENEIVLFEERSKLYRLHLESHEWKERGIGKMKILKNEETGIVRLVMRREQVFKVCCNHRLTKELELMSTPSPNMYKWATRDFSEDNENGQNEAFLIKFKTHEQALKFKEAFDTAKESLESRPVESKPEIPSSDKPPLSSLIKPGWTCSACYIKSDVDKDECPACGTPNPNKPAAPKAAESKFSFGIPSNENSSAPKPQSSDKPPLSSLVKPGWTCSACYIQSDIDKNECPACGTPNPNKPAAPKAAEASKFSFGIPAPTEVSVCKPNEGTPDKFVFGMKNSALDFNQKSEDKPAFAFGSKPEEKPKLDFTFGSKISSPGLTNFKFSFQKDAPQTFGQPAPTAKENESDDEVVEDEGDHIHFEPIIPLPAKVDLVTGEEDEDVLYVQRAKLFRFADETSEWKERGVGDVKILKHRTTKKIRIIMRRDNVKKLCLNHYLTPEIKMNPKDEKSWVWCANDYSENVMAAEKFAMRFKNEEIAQAFHDKILECQADALSGDTSLAPSESQDDEDIQIIFVKEVSEELKKKAAALLLPSNYYSYEDCEPCSGCRGCYSDEEDDEDD